VVPIQIFYLRAFVASLWARPGKSEQRKQVAEVNDAVRAQGSITVGDIACAAWSSAWAWTSKT